MDTRPKKDQPEEKGMAYWEKQRRKLDQELKKSYDVRRKELVKDRKNLELDKKAVHNEWQRFLSDKKDMEVFTQKLELEKEQWLKHVAKNKKKKGPSEGPMYLAQITTKVQELAAKQGQVKKDLEEQRQLRVTLKGEKTEFEKGDRGDLRKEEALLENDRKEYEEVSGGLNKRKEDCEKEEARLKEVKGSLEDGEKRVQDQLEEFEKLKLSLAERDQAMKTKAAELDEERALLGGVKEQLTSSAQREKREELAKKFNSLATVALQWNSSFAGLFTNFGIISDEMKEEQTNLTTLRNNCEEPGSAVMEASKA